ncbi:MAG TPA: hypothetical protein VMV37_03235, partial [Gammaproteobacteria bacterium]|nr:hypothetical protein [Gammaproteobacteria bacterium]
CEAAYKSWLVDDPTCWEGNGGLNAQTAVALEGAQRSAANYLYAVATSYNCTSLPCPVMTA